MIQITSQIVMTDDSGNEQKLLDIIRENHKLAEMRINRYIDWDELIEHLKGMEKLSGIPQDQYYIGYNHAVRDIVEVCKKRQHAER